VTENFNQSQGLWREKLLFLCLSLCLVLSWRRLGLEEEEVRITRLPSGFLARFLPGPAILGRGEEGLLLGESRMAVV
jgi:hypothetical protein